MKNELNVSKIKQIVRNALVEDIGSGDATTLAVIPENLTIKASIVSREDCICAGLPLVESVFSELDSSSSLKRKVKEGEICFAGQILAEIEGRARAVLTGERLALNFLQRMSGIATMTGKFVEAVKHTKTKILDTRKTTPGLRLLEKYAVTAGGGTNHRFALYDRVMIKDNHRAIAGMEGDDGIIRSVKACREKYPDLEVEVEADSLEDVQQAVEAKADYILLDNMSCEELKEAIKITKNISLLEASGGVTLKTVSKIAETGVDYISVGALTHSVKSIDIGLDFEG
ncbi:MAG: carboxylating nicotinate-nucleotide diphosphorylase [Verrucomicrobiota bacterium]|nr:carboxylating nicotinate-nucleotide diphosphorylase [Verrucomicrobiota bacterium]